MRQLLVYLNPEKKFDDIYNSEKLMEVQIDNCLLFVKTDNLLVVTNFPYEYKGVKALIIPDEVFCSVDAKASKVTAVVHLLERDLLPGLTWIHDLDAFQLAPIDITLEKDFGVADYGYKAYWNLGSIFIKPGAIDIYHWLKDEVYRRKANEEPIFNIFTKYNTNNINSRFQKIDNTYNVGMRQTEKVISLSEKPIRVAHFPPHLKDTYEMFKPILTRNLIELINDKYYNGEK